MHYNIERLFWWKYANMKLKEQIVMMSFKGIHEPNHLRKWPLAKNGLIYGEGHFKMRSMAKMKIFRVNWRGRSQRLIEGYKSFIGLLAAVTTVLDKENNFVVLSGGNEHSIVSVNWALQKVVTNWESGDTKSPLLSFTWQEMLYVRQTCVQKKLENNHKNG